METNENDENNAADTLQTESPEALETKGLEGHSEIQQPIAAADVSAPEAFPEPEFHIGFISGNDVKNMGYDNFNAMCFNFALLCFGFYFLKWASALFEKAARRLGKDGERS